MDFDEWLKQCKELLREEWPDYPFVDNDGQIDAEAWREYYADGLSPEDSVAAEIDASH